MNVLLGFIAILIFEFCASVPAEAKVERLEIVERIPFANGLHFGRVGAYERIQGRLHYSVDPSDPANGFIVDLTLAPTDGRGMVVFSGDFMLLRPLDGAQGNQRLLYEVGNRGNIGALSYFNDAKPTNQPLSLADSGNGFLFHEGYTLLWSAWNWDVVEGNDRMQINLPIARNTDGSSITGTIVAEITTNFSSQCEPIVWGNSRGYSPVHSFLDSSTLSVRARQLDLRQNIDRSRWSFGCMSNDSPEVLPTNLYLADRFKPGFLYELSYITKNPRIVGLGLASIRDAMSFFRFDKMDHIGELNPLWGGIDNALIFGISQSGRVIQHMIFQNFHRDESERMVFDGALVHVAGGGKGSFNHRFAQTTRHPSVHEDHQYVADFFPFATVPQRDHITGEDGDVLEHAKEAKAVPKIFYTTTSTEYWGRSASLLHTDTQGRADIALDERARLYFFSGAQHGVWSFGHRAIYENCINPLDYRPLLRALLGHLGRWVEGTGTPPKSIYPNISNGALGTVSQWQLSFPEIPGARVPTYNLAPPKLDNGPRWDLGIIDHVPPRLGPVYTTLVPMSDHDGLDLGGLRLPMIEAPLGTHLGWNLRREKFGASDYIGRWSGSFLPFEIDEQRRKETGDPRLSIERRYGNQNNYLSAIEVAANQLYQRGFLLKDDINRILGRALAFHSQLMQRDQHNTSCDYTIF